MKEADNRENGLENRRADRHASRREGESGQVLVLTAVVMAALMGFLALAIDAGMLLYSQRELQTAADAAALAGALESGTCGATSDCAAMQGAAKSAVTENGFATPTVVTQCGSSGASGVILTVNNGPCALGASDPNHANTAYVEAELSYKQTTFFGILLGHSLVQLWARSEAKSTTTGGTGNSACLYVGSMVLNTNSSMTMTCGIQDNGSLGADNNADITATPSFTYAGGVAYNNCGTSGSTVWTGGSCSFPDAKPTAGSAVADPLASKTAPGQPATSSTAGNTTPSNGATLQPGYYPNGINLNSGVGVTLAAGTYYMNGSINVNAGASLTGTGVTLYFTSGSLQMNTTSTIQLSAPNNGTYAGMVIWESTGNGAGMTIDADSASYFQGIIYFPDTSAALTLNSDANVNADYTIIDVGGQLILDSNETFSINNNYSGLSGGNPLGGGGTTTASLSE